MPTEEDDRDQQDEAVRTIVELAPEYALAGALPDWDLLPEAPLVRRR